MNSEQSRAITTSYKQIIIKDEVFVISGIIKDEVSIISPAKG